MKLTIRRYPHIDNALSVYSGQKWLGHVFCPLLFSETGTEYLATPWNAEPRSFPTETMAILYLECAA